MQRSYNEFLAVHEYLIDHFLEEFIMCEFPKGMIKDKLLDRSIAL